MSEYPPNPNPEEPNPYQVGGAEGRVSEGPVFGAAYWFFSILILVVLIAMAVLTVPQGNPIFAMIFAPSLMATVRSAQFVRRVQARRRNGLRTVLPDPVAFYCSSFVLGCFGAFASTVAFVATCIPMGTLTLSNTVDQSLQMAVFGFGVAVCALLGISVGIFINRLFLPKASEPQKVLGSETKTPLSDEVAPSSDKATDV